MTKETELRPWGGFSVLAAEEGFQVKRLRVTPGQKLSLQQHKERDELWVVVRGVATVTHNKEQQKFFPRETILIRRGEKHRLANDADEELIVVEVQFGSYLAEDDIVRFEDIYGRV